MDRTKYRRGLYWRFLDLGISDLSQHSGWRRRLFAASPYQPFPIDAAHTEGLPDSTASGIRRHKLSYVVCCVTQEETPFHEPGWEGLIFFRFQARKYPDIVRFSANNPDVI
jgi:hypothetical protein